MSRPDNMIYISFANLLSYPDTCLKDDVTLLISELDRYPEDKKDLQEFAAFIGGAEQTDVEELYTRTFDLNATCCLEIGWHLYGEDYRRGEFLVQMRQSLQEEDLTESHELPDHISHCLLLLTRLEPDDAHEFTCSYLLPALEKILAGFKAGENNPYYNIVGTLRTVLHRDFEIELPHPALNVVGAASAFERGNGIQNSVVE